MTAFAGSRGTLVVGIVLGEPTGVAAKWYLKDDQAMQAAVGSAFIGGGLQLHGNYVLHSYLLHSRESYVLPVYVGVGVRLIDCQNGREARSFALGRRLVGGLLLDFKTVPLEAFIEVAPLLERIAGATLALCDAPRSPSCALPLPLPLPAPAPSQAVRQPSTSRCAGLPAPPSHSSSCRAWERVPSRARRGCA
jgi:hypothetical protein